MSENLNKMVDAAQTGEASKFKSAFEDEVLSRIAVSMDNKRAEIASTLFDADQNIEADEVQQEEESEETE